MSDSQRDTPRPQGEAFSLSRWSARKRAAITTAADDQRSELARSEAVTDGADAGQPTPPRELTDADMPPLESIDEHSDLSGFFSPKVSAELRRLALRKLFRLPVYNIRDGLNDYDEDYTRFEPLGDIVTADLRHQREMLAAREAERQPNAEQQATAGVSQDAADDVADSTDDGVESDDPREQDAGGNATVGVPDDAQRTAQPDAPPQDDKGRPA